MHLSSKYNLHRIVKKKKKKRNRIFSFCSNFIRSKHVVGPHDYTKSKRDNKSGARQGCFPFPTKTLKGDYLWEVGGPRVDNSIWCEWPTLIRSMVGFVLYDFVLFAIEALNPFGGQWKKIMHSWKLNFSKQMGTVTMISYDCFSQKSPVVLILDWKVHLKLLAFISVPFMPTSNKMQRCQDIWDIFKEFVGYFVDTHGKNWQSSKMSIFP